MIDYYRHVCLVQKEQIDWFVKKFALIYLFKYIFNIFFCIYSDDENVDSILSTMCNILDFNNKDKFRSFIQELKTKNGLNNLDILKNESLDKVKTLNYEKNKIQNKIKKFFNNDQMKIKFWGNDNDQEEKDENNVVTSEFTDEQKDESGVEIEDSEIKQNNDEKSSTNNTTHYKQVNSISQGGLSVSTMPTETSSQPQPHKGSCCEIL